MKKYDYKKSARTDKWVSASSNYISIKLDIK